MLHLGLSLLPWLVPSPLLAQEAAPEPALPEGWSLAAPVQANEFTWSSQDAVALAHGPDGGFVLVWQSRRQQAGNYGVYARRFDAAGRPLTDEVEVNAHTAGPQTRPTVAFDAEGRLWFAWESLGQDGDAGAVVARRFDGLLETSTPEVVVHELAAGDQREPALACAADGTALVAWTTPGAAEGSRRVHARLLGADGAPLGASFEVGGVQRAFLPAITALEAGGFTVAWSDHGDDGFPRSIRARDVAADGALAAADVALFEVEGRQPVEPVLCADAGGLLAAWQVAEGEDYLPHVQRFTRTDGAWTAAGEPVVVRDALPGYTSGLDLAALADGRALVAWTRFEGSRDAQLRGAILGADGALGPVFALTESLEGPQRLAVGGGARRVVALADGRAAIAWNGDAGASDGNAAHLTLVGPAVEAAAAEVLTVARFDAPERVEDEGAGPHEPPIGSGGAVRREDFGWTKSLAGPDFGFLAITQTPLTPPDPYAAAGPNHIVAVTNGAIAWFLKDGTFQFQQPIDGGAGFWAPVGGNGFIFDPEVIFDPDSRRFMAMANERNGGQAFFLLAVSDDDDPNGTWHKYRFNVTAAATDSDIDSPNMGVDETAIYLSADFFGPDKYLTFIVEKAPTLVGGVPTTRSLLNIGSQSWGNPVMDGPAPAFYMAEAFETLTSTTIRLHAITDPLGSPVDTTFDLTVPLYQQPEDPPQAGTTIRPETFEARIWSSYFRDGRLYISHHQGAARVLHRWYEIDMANWPVSGTPTLVQSGDVDPGPGIRTFFGSIGVDGQGNIGLTYARSSPSEFISMARSYHLFGSPAGSSTPAVIMKASSGPDFTGRWGDYSSTVADPDLDGVFWANHEFREGSWATWVGAFGPCAAPVTYCTAKTTSLGGTPSIGSTGEPSVGQNAFELTLTGAIPNTNAIYFFGDSSANLPFFNAIRCVGDPITRSGLAITNGAGFASLGFDCDIDELGQTRYAQWWFRDVNQADGTGVGLSDGIEFTICP